jgi:Xaa-Pro dipeptidase
MATKPPSQHNVLMDVSFYRKRISRIQEHLATQGLDGLLLLNSNNIMWATGFFHIPSERPIGCYFPVDGDPVFFVPFLEKEHAEGNALGDVRCYWEYPGEIPAEVWMLQKIGGEQVAVDTAGHRIFLMMQEVTPALHLDDGVAKMRYLKSDE